MTKSRSGLPFLGYGVGLRRPHWDRIWDYQGSVDFLEVLSENFMAFGGRPRRMLERAAREFPVVVHGTALSIGSVDPLDEDYLDQLARLCRVTDALLVSDHLCFSSAFGVEYHDLIPVPFTEEALDHVVERTKQVMAAMPVPFALENPSYYIQYGDSELDEAQFLHELILRADYGLLLDVNNVYVNSVNHGYDPRAFIDAMPLDRVMQIHMAGHHQDGDVVIDTHGAHIIPEVMALYEYTLERTGPVSTLLEWDTEIPSIEVLVAENQLIREAGQRAIGEVSPWRRPQA